MTSDSRATAAQEISDNNSNAGEGIAQEVPNTSPFEGFSYFKKEWVDHEDNIESVTFSMALSSLNKPANWDNMQSFSMMPEWGTTPLKRSWVVRIPTHFAGAERYLFHYFFQIRYVDGSEKVSDDFTQLIMPRKIEYIDHSGTCVHLKIHWSLNDWTYPQNTELEVDGIAWGDEYSVSHAPYRSGDRLYEGGRAATIAQIKVPRVFRGLIWAPHGEVVNYCFSLEALDEAGIVRKVWNNNGGKNFKLTV